MVLSLHHPQIEFSDIAQAISICKSGGIIAYPTEAVFGLGCMPLNQTSVNKILKLKQRSINKGLILVASGIRQLDYYVDFEQITDIQHVLASWPGPVTWLIPSKQETPTWLTGKHETLAVRVSSHPVVRELCEQLGPIVSTSANLQGTEPARSSQVVAKYFQGKIDYIIPANIKEMFNPTEIRDAMSGDIIRAS